MHPHLTYNYFAMLTAIVGCFAFGGIWYGPLFGRTWAQLIGFSMDKKPDAKTMRKNMLLQLVGLILLVWVMAHTVQVWRPSVWGVGPDESGAMYGVFAAIFTWIGFKVPVQLGRVSWEAKPWKLFFINVGHDLINLLIVGIILSVWR